MECLGCGNTYEESEIGMKKPTRWKPPKDLDKECLGICTAMNRLPGLFTIESCCGHGDTPYWIFFRLSEDTPEGLMEGLPMLLYWMRHFGGDCHESEWNVQVSTDCSGMDATFTLEGPTGDQGVEESKAIAKCLEEVLDRDARVEARLKRLKKKHPRTDAMRLYEQALDAEDAADLKAPKTQGETPSSPSTLLN
jgi:hypothetical protein